MRNAMVWLALLCAYPVAAAGQPDALHPLKQVLIDAGCETSGLPAAAASARVDTFSVLHDGDACLIAFFRGGKQLGAPLEVVSSDRGARSWKYSKVSLGESDGGRVVRIDVEAGVALIGLGETNSGVATVVLNPNLKPLGMLHGTFVRAWPNALLQYDARRSDLDPGISIGVFDPETAADRTIFQSDGEILAPLYFDWQTDTFAFALETGSRMIVTCERLASVTSITCRETPLDAWQGARPDLNLRQLVTFAAGQPHYLR